MREAEGDSGCVVVQLLDALVQGVLYSSSMLQALGVSSECGS